MVVNCNAVGWRNIKKNIYNEEQGYIHSFVIGFSKLRTFLNLKMTIIVIIIIPIGVSKFVKYKDNLRLHIRVYAELFVIGFLDWDKFLYLYTISDSMIPILGLL